MPSNFKINTGPRNAVVDTLGARLNGGNIEIWEAVAGPNPPASPGTSIADDDTNYKKLAQCTFGATAFGPGSNGTATANPITSDTNAAKTGTAEFFRCRTSANAVEWQGTAGEASSTPDMVFDNASIVATGTVAISSMSLTMPVGGS